KTLRQHLLGASANDDVVAVGDAAAQQLVAHRSTHGVDFHGVLHAFAVPARAAISVRCAYAGRQGESWPRQRTDTPAPPPPVPLEQIRKARGSRNRTRCPWSST